MNKSLLDTDILSEISKAVDKGVVRQARQYLDEFGRFTLSTVTVMEVARGYYLASRLDRLQSFVDSLAINEILPFEQSTGLLAGKIDAELIRLGQPIGRADPMIAATAIEHSLELVTGNVDHFSRIRDLGYPLKLSNWRSA